MHDLIRKSKQFDKIKKRVVIDWLMGEQDRTSQRRALAKKWLEEGEYANYRYNVETCFDGSQVYLLRPTWLNKGFDFQVNVEGFKSSLRNSRTSTVEMPSHSDIIEDLRLKVKYYPDLKEDIFLSICDIYDCCEPEESIYNHPSLEKIDVGLPVDKLLKIIKWLFIEQDLTYWLQTGRNMLMSGIERDVFCLCADLKK